MSVPHIDAMVNDVLLAAGQGIGQEKPIDFDVVVWWRARYKAFFQHAITELGNSWDADRHRVTAVGRYLGQRAAHHAASSPSIDLRAAAQASHDVERGCRMNAERDGVVTPAPNATA